jgi:hypothetical protein
LRDLHLPPEDDEAIISIVIEPPVSDLDNIPDLYNILPDLYNIPDLQYIPPVLHVPATTPPLETLPSLPSPISSVLDAFSVPKSLSAMRKRRYLKGMYEPNFVVGHIFLSSVLFLRIRWVGYGPKDDTYESLSCARGSACSDLFYDYMNAHDLL